MKHTMLELWDFCMGPKMPLAKYGTVMTLMFLAGCTVSKTKLKEHSNQRPNVLFIAVDDLRPELGCYGKSQVHSPNIDALAKKGFLFERAYCNVPVCGASRASILTGLRPTPNRFLTYKSYINEDAPGIITLPELFKNNGYSTLSLGKVVHHWQDDALQSWTEPPWNPQAFEPGSPGRQRLNYQLPKNKEKKPSYEKAEAVDSAYHDGKIAKKAIEKLQLLSQDGTPFFMAVGFIRPHLPFNAPNGYWDMHDPNTIGSSRSIKFPIHGPEVARHSFSELRTYDDIPKDGGVSDEMARTLIHGYYASVSYVDAQIGLVIDELNRLNLTNNTIIVLWGDHGWSLGEHGLWCKHSTFNVAMQAPLIVSIPDRKGGHKIQGLVEFVDIYPSLTDLAKLPKPEHLQGESFAHLLDNPNSKGKEAIYGRWKNSDFIKTDRYAYTEWFSENGTSLASMLYDHLKDPDETINVAELEENKTLVDSLSIKVQQIRNIK